MATLNTESLFTSYNLTEEEILAGCSFTITQRQFIQNLISESAHEKVKLQFVESNRQREAELQGAILSLQYLLDFHKSLNQPTV